MAMVVVMIAVVIKCGDHGGDSSDDGGCQW
jgi:hypothetical protein